MSILLNSLLHTYFHHNPTELGSYQSYFMPVAATVVNLLVAIFASIPHRAALVLAVVALAPPILLAYYLESPVLWKWKCATRYARAPIYPPLFAALLQAFTLFAMLVRSVNRVDSILVEMFKAHAVACIYAAVTVLCAHASLAPDQKQNEKRADILHTPPIKEAVLFLALVAVFASFDAALVIDYPRIQAFSIYWVLPGLLTACALFAAARLGPLAIQPTPAVKAPDHVDDTAFAVVFALWLLHLSFFLFRHVALSITTATVSQDPATALLPAAYEVLGI